MTEKSYKGRNSISGSIVRRDSCAQGESSYPGNCYTGLPAEDYTLRDIARKGSRRGAVIPTASHGYLDAVLSAGGVSCTNSPRHLFPGNLISLSGDFPFLLGRAKPPQASVHRGLPSVTCDRPSLGYRRAVNQRGRIIATEHTGHRGLANDIVSWHRVGRI